MDKYGVWRPNSSVLQDIWHKLVDDDALSEERNNVKMKHATAGTNIGNSLTSDSQLELLGQESVFNRDDEYDGMELWDHIRTEVNLSTMVGACALKE